MFCPECGKELKETEKDGEIINYEFCPCANNEYHWQWEPFIANGYTRIFYKAT